MSETLRNRKTISPMESTDEELNATLSADSLPTRCRFLVRTGLDAKIMGEQNGAARLTKVVKITDSNLGLQCSTELPKGSVFEIDVPSLLHYLKVKSPLECKILTIERNGQGTFDIEAEMLNLTPQKKGELKGISDCPDQLQDNKGFWHQY